MASVSSDATISNQSQPFIPPKYRVAAKNIKNALVSSVAIVAFLLLATAATSLIVFSGFMFSIGVIPDGIYLLIGAIAVGAFAAYVGYKAYQRCMMTHNCLHHPKKIKP